MGSFAMLDPFIWLPFAGGFVFFNIFFAGIFFCCVCFLLFPFFSSLFRVHLVSSVNHPKKGALA